MREIVKLTGELQARLAEEMEELLAERSVARQILEARARELALKRDDEMKRIDQWSAQQKALVSEVFAAMLAETQADLDKNEALMTRIGGEFPAAGRTVPARSLNKAAAAFAKAAE